MLSQQAAARGKTQQMSTPFMLSRLLSPGESAELTERNATRVARALALVLALSAFLVIPVNPADANPDEKTWEDFIQTVWAFESSIDPSQKSFYKTNWDKPVLDPYPLVYKPGRVVRDYSTGNPVMSGPLTVSEYFEAIGIAQFFHKGTPLTDWESIQSKVVNYLGFVGFQFQESDLHDLGYYIYGTHYVSGYYPSHYVDIPNSNWAYGITGFLDTDPNQVSEPTYVTDVIHWDAGTFTGKNGVHNYRDFTNPEKHKIIIQDHFKNKFDGIVTGLTQHGKTLDDYLGTTVTWNGLDPSVSPPPGGRSNSVTITLSGLLAGAHLRGAEGVIELLVMHENPADESGTYILQYVQDYAGYETPFKP